MLINAQSPEELRIAVVDGPTLEELQVEVAERGLTRGNIYRGRIANIQPSLNAAFIDYGAERHGFLALQDLVPEAYYRQPKGKGRPKIEDVLDRGKSIVVQVTKEPEGQKGAALTTNLSLAGRYLVLTPFDSSIGVSRKVNDDETRKSLKELVKKLEVPDGCGAIVRTNAHGQNKTTLTRDLNALLRLWKRIGAEARKGKEIKLLYSDQDVILQSLRDYLDTTIEEVVVDDESAHAKAEQYMRAFMPRSKTQLIRYDERTPIFSKYHLETQIDRIYQRSVELPSGGSIVIDRAEALTAIDINSGRSTKAKSQEETALHTNLESAEEVARQLRLRDIGGLIVVDFIDMRTMKNRRKVEKTLRDAMKPDKARFEVGRISSNGLLEINRQRIKQALLMRTHHACPTCGGTGRLASPELVGLNLVRRIEARAASGAINHVKITLHAEVADAVQNQRRRELAAIEQEFGISIEVVSSSRFHPSEQKIDWTARPSEERDAVPKEPTPRPKLGKVATLSDAPSDQEAADEEEENGRSRRRRRRGGRRRRRGGAEDGLPLESRDAAEATETTAAEEGTDSEETNASDDGQNSSSRRRRGRRGGRSRRRANSQDEGSSAAGEAGAIPMSGASGTSDTSDTSETQTSSDTNSVAAGDTDEARQEPPPRRRGRGTRRGRSGRDTEGRSPSSEASSPDGPEAVADGDADTAKADATPNERPRRGRRGRSRRNGGDVAGAAPTNGTEALEPAESKGAASAETAPPPESNNGQEGPTKPRGTADTIDSQVADLLSEDTSPAKPARRSRSGRRSRTSDTTDEGSASTD